VAMSCLARWSFAQRKASKPCASTLAPRMTTSGSFSCARMFFVAAAARSPQKFVDRNGSFASAKNPTEGEVGEAVQRASRHDLVRALAPRYGHVSKCEKGQILDRVCEVTGYTRKYALTLLTDPAAEEARVKRTRQSSASYGPEEVELLRLSWLGD
jgi:hypothetical protein